MSLGHVRTHVKVLEWELHHGVQLVGAPGAVSEPLEGYHQHIRYRPHSQLLDNFSLLITLGAEECIILA